MSFRSANAKIQCHAWAVTRLNGMRFVWKSEACWETVFYPVWVPGGVVLSLWGCQPSACGPQRLMLKSLCAVSLPFTCLTILVQDIIWQYRCRSWIRRRSFRSKDRIGILHHGRNNPKDLAAWPALPLAHVLWSSLPFQCMTKANLHHRELDPPSWRFG